MDRHGNEARIRAVDHTTADSDLQALLAKTHAPGSQPLNVMLTLALRPPLMSRFNGLITEIVLRGTLPGRDREIVILAIAARAGCSYEFTQHEPLGLREGVTADEIALLRDGTGDEETWSPEDRDLLAFAADMVAGGDVSAELWEELSARYTEPELVELALIGGIYTGLASFLKALQIEVEG